MKTAKPSPTKTANKKPASKGKRYTPAERKAVLSFVESVNAKKGRGGVAAAVKKFGVTALTISAWIKKEGGTVKTVKVAAKTSPKVAAAPGRKQSRKQEGDVLDQLVALRDEITGLEGQLAEKQAQFARLKAEL